MYLGVPFTRDLNLYMDIVSNYYGITKWHQTLYIISNNNDQESTSIKHKLYYKLYPIMR